MKVEIDVPYPPGGYRVDGWRKANRGEAVFTPNKRHWEIWEADFESSETYVVAVPIPPPHKPGPSPTKVFSEYKAGTHIETMESWNRRHKKHLVDSMKGSILCKTCNQVFIHSELPPPHKPKRKVWPLKLTPDGRPFVAAPRSGDAFLSSDGRVQIYLPLRNKSDMTTDHLILDAPIEIEDTK